MKPVGLVVGCTLTLATACGGSVTGEPADGGGGRRGGGGRDAAVERVVDARADAVSEDGFPVFHEDMCPDAPADPPMLECDPFAQDSGQCSPGFGCYPLTPRGSDPCHPGRYSTLCFPAGPGMQGSPCSDGAQCGAGFICVKTASGDVCAKLCRTSQFDDCDFGRVCRVVDVGGSGIGACD